MPEQTNSRSDYVNKSGVAALRGIGRTGRLDDDGLPELSWYGVPVSQLTVARILETVLERIEFDTLEPEERGVILQVIYGDLGGKAFQRDAIKRIVKGYRRG